MELQITHSSELPIQMLPVSEDSEDIANASERSSLSLYPPSKQTNVRAPKNVPLEKRLYDARATCKIKTATVAMHLDSEWRSPFFSQIDNLMDVENWEEDDLPITEASFTTLLRMILLIRPVRRPGLGSTSAGNILAAWTVERDQLTIECLPDDVVRWVLSRYPDGHRESAAGHVPLSRLKAVLEPYNPERWFA